MTNKTIFKNKEYSLIGEKVKAGDVINFQATTKDFEQISIDNFDRLTLISVFPSVMTRVCDEQTKEISKLSSKYPNVRFISLSVDLPSAISEWLMMNGSPNIEFYSDHRKREFGTKYGYLIDEIFLLNRGWILVNNEGKVITSSYNSNVHEQINFEEIESLINQNLK